MLFVNGRLLLGGFSSQNLITVADVVLEVADPEIEVEAEVEIEVPDDIEIELPDEIEIEVC